MTGPKGHIPPWHTCPDCGKRTFASRKAAKAAARIDSLQRLSAYECHGRPGAWHLGHQHAGIIHGQYGRDQLSRHHHRKQRRPA